MQNEWLVRRQEERSASWSAFVEKMCERCNTVDEEFATEVKRVEDYYKDLEQKTMKDETSSHTWWCSVILSTRVLFTDTTDHLHCVVLLFNSRSQFAMYLASTYYSHHNTSLKRLKWKYVAWGLRMASGGMHLTVGSRECCSSPSGAKNEFVHFLSFSPTGGRKIQSVYTDKYTILRISWKPQIKLCNEILVLKWVL